MAIDYSKLAQPKGPSRKKLKAKQARVHRGNVTEVRAYVFGRERNICRCCRFRPAESMHELTPKSLGGKVSKTNSVALCGDGVSGCHGFLQRHEIDWCEWTLSGSAEEALYFHAATRAAADWMRVKQGHILESLPMLAMEMAE